MFIMPKHVFYNLSYGITMSNTIKEIIKNGFNNYKKDKIIIIIAKDQSFY
jgi:hypothetical protein